MRALASPVAAMLLLLLAAAALASQSVDVLHGKLGGATTLDEEEILRVLSHQNKTGATSDNFTFVELIGGGRRYNDTALGSAHVIPEHLGVTGRGATNPDYGESLIL